MPRTDGGNEIAKNAVCRIYMVAILVNSTVSMQPGGIVGGRFLLERLAGVGGMGEVFRALDQETGQRVALKRVLDASDEETTRFVREARILAELDHPHVVRYVAHGVDPLGTPWLAMEWLSGEDLRTRIDRGPLGLSESVELATHIASALGAAHARGIIHRDIKPSNLFLPEGRIDAVKLLDFGVARAGTATRRTGTNVLVGTPGYMAPEQTRGKTQVDARADIFALGAVLFEMIAGEPAFKGEHVMAILTKILFEDPPRPREWRPDCPPELEALITRMLSKDPADRPENGEAAMLALSALAEPLARLEGPVTSHKRREALTQGERRAIAVVVISPDPTSDPDTEAANTLDETLRDEARRFSGRFERLLDGSAVVLLSGTAIATDLCAQAARCALALRDHAEGRSMALAMERAEITSSPPISGAIERAVRLLVERPTSSSPAKKNRAPIAVDDVVAGLLDARFDLREEGGALVLRGERPTGSGARTLLGKPTSCVGRDRELRSLEETFDECAREELAQATLVTAAPGIGKTRLASELLRRIEKRGMPVTVWVARADALRAGSTFGLLQSLVAQAAGFFGGEPQEVRREKLVAWVKAHVPAAKGQALAELLGEIAGVFFPDEASPALREARKTPELLGERARSAWLAVLEASLQRGPTVLVLEDLQWGDLPSVQLLDRALRDFNSRPLFVLALARPAVLDIFPKLWADRRMQELRLRELPRKASMELARQVLGESVGPETLERIVKLSEGNAFYLEELIRATAERKSEALPGTVVAMVQSRLGALDEMARRVLRAASVLGEVFWTGGVAELVGFAEHGSRIAEALARLAEEELVTRSPHSRFPGETEYAFRHALVREGAYAMLIDEDRALGHRLAAAWLEARGELDPFVLAEHYEKGQEPSRAAEFWLRAAERAAWARDFGAAGRHARRGLELVTELEVKCALLGMLCQVQVYQHDWAAAGATADGVIRLAKPGSGAWGRALLARLFAAQAGVVDDGTNPLAVLDLLLKVDPAPDAIVSVVVSLSTVLFVMLCLGRFDLARACVRRIVAITTHLEEDGSEAARAVFDACLPTLEVSRGMYFWLIGSYAEAAPVLRRALASPERLGPSLAFGETYLGETLIALGKVEEAIEVANRLISLGLSTGNVLDEGRGRWVLADALRAQGDLEAAEKEARHAVELLRPVPLDNASVIASHAAVLLAQGRVPEALAAASEARALHTGHAGVIYRRIYVAVMYAECLAASGEKTAAADVAAGAKAWIETAAASIEDPAHRRCFLEGMLENARALELARTLA